MTASSDTSASLSVYSFFKISGPTTTKNLDAALNVKSVKECAFVGATEPFASLLSAEFQKVDVLFEWTVNNDRFEPCGIGLVASKRIMLSAMKPLELGRK